MRNFPQIILYMITIMTVMLMQPATANATGTPCVMTLQIFGTAAAIKGVGTGTGCASTSDVASNTVATAAQAAVDSAIKRAEEAAKDRVEDAINGTADDQKKEIELGKILAKGAADAMMNHAPTPGDCAALTSSTIKMASATPLAKRANDLFTTENGPNDWVKGKYASDKPVKGSKAPNNSSPSYGSSAELKTKFAQDIAKLKNDGKPVTTGEAIEKCLDSDCYNKTLDQTMLQLMANAASDKAPWKAKSNPEINEYFTKRAKWEDDTLQAYATIRKILPKMYKQKQFYDMAFKDYQDNNIDTGLLLQQYPNSNNIGLSQFELQEAEFFAINSAGQQLVTISQNQAQMQRAAQLLQAQAAQLQISKMQREEFFSALQTVGIPAPVVSSSAISVQ